MTETNIAKKENEMSILSGLLESKKEAMMSLLPKHLTAERLIKLALLSVSKNQLLTKCTSASILKSVMTSAQLGLEIGGVLPEAHLVPFWNKQLNGYEAQLIPDYRGLIKLASEAGITLEAHIIRESDIFHVRYGNHPNIHHEPKLSGGKTIGVYAIAWIPSKKDPVFEIMNLEQIDEIMNRTKSKSKEGEIYGSWATDKEEMTRKTVVKRLFKYLPRGEKLTKAIEVEAETEGEIEDTNIFKIAEPKRLSENVEDMPIEVESGETLEKPIEAEAKTEAKQTEVKPKKPKLSTENLIATLKTCKSRNSLNQTWNEFYSEDYTEEEKANLIEWKEKLSEELKK